MSFTIEFVAGPRCGQTEILGHCPVGRPPLTVALAGERAGSEPGATYCRRDDRPDPRSGRWLFDHVPAPIDRLG